MLYSNLLAGEDIYQTIYVHIYIWVFCKLKIHPNVGEQHFKSNCPVLVWMMPISTERSFVLQRTILLCFSAETVPKPSLYALHLPLPIIPPAVEAGLWRGLSCSHPSLHTSCPRELSQHGRQRVPLSKCESLWEHHANEVFRFLLPGEWMHED